MTRHRYYSVGSWARIQLTKDFFAPKKAVFLDRDGTLNVRPPKAHYIEKPDDFIWLDEAKEAVRLLHQAGYLLFLFTNQPGIARGVMTQHQLDLIHLKMQSELQETVDVLTRFMYARMDGMRTVTVENRSQGCSIRRRRIIP